MIKMRKQLAVLLVIMLALSAITGCSKKGGGSAGGGDRDFYQIEVFSQPANYMGVNQGWWGKVLKDELNMELNIIAPSVAGTGDALYQTRTAAGHLGDLLCLDKTRIIDLQKVKMVLNLRPYLDSGKYPTLQGKLHVAYDKFAEMFSDNGVYGIPGRVSTRPPTEAAGRGVDPEQAIFLRYDWFNDVGHPEVDGLDGLLDVVEKMVKAHPTTEAGEKTYGFSSFPDWDAGTVRLAREMLFCMGYTNASSFIWMSNDGKKLTYFMDDNGEYKKVLAVMNQAYRRGLLDPDSSTQNFDTTKAKYDAGRIAMGYWTFTATSIFTRLDLNVRAPYAVIPVKGMVINNVGFNPYGLEGRAYAIGAKAKYPERIMELMDYLCSPKGALNYNYQVEGFTYEMKDGQPYLTDFSLDPNPDKQAPAELGGGSWNQGIQRLNFPITHQDEPNDLLNGYSLNSNLWPSVIEMNRNQWNTMYREKYGAENPLDLLEKRGLLAVTPGTDYTAPTAPTDINNKRNQLGSIIAPAGWQMIYAKTDAEFESIWKTMKGQLDDFGYQDVIAWDLKTIEDRAASIERTLKAVGK